MIQWNHKKARKIRLGNYLFCEFFSNFAIHLLQYCYSLLGSLTFPMNRIDPWFRSRMENRNGLSTVTTSGISMSPENAAISMPGSKRGISQRVFQLKRKPIRPVGLRNWKVLGKFILISVLILPLGYIIWTRGNFWWELPFWLQYKVVCYVLILVVGYMFFYSF